MGGSSELPSLTQTKLSLRTKSSGFSLSMAFTKSWQDSQSLKTGMTTKTESEEVGSWSVKTSEKGCKVKVKPGKVKKARPNQGRLQGIEMISLH